MKHLKMTTENFSSPERAPSDVARPLAAECLVARIDDVICVPLQKQNSPRQ